MTGRYFALAASAAISLACAAEARGRVRLLSSRVVPNLYAAMYYPRVEGRACYESLFSRGKDAIELALVDALAKRPEANALALIKFRLEGNCFVLEGTPAKLK